LRGSRSFSLPPRNLAISLACHASVIKWFFKSFSHYSVSPLLFARFVC
jgi:hypothetical protein